MESGKTAMLGGGKAQQDVLDLSHEIRIRINEIRSAEQKPPVGKMDIKCAESALFLFEAECITITDELDQLQQDRNRTHPSLQCLHLHPRHP